MFNTRFVLFRALALCACLLLSVLLTGCGGGSSSSTASNGPVTSATRTSNNLTFTLSADKSVYAVGEKAQFTLTVTNVGTQSITLGFPDAATHQFQVSQNGQLINLDPQGSADIITSDTYMAGQTKVFTGSWNQSVFSTGQRETSGQYVVSAWLPARDINGTALSETDAQTLLAANPVSITIK